MTESLTQRTESFRMRARRRWKVAVFAFEGIHPFLMTFPMRIFRDASEFARDVDIELRIFSTTPGRIRLDAIETLELEVRHGMEAIDGVDLIVIPAWQGVDIAAPEGLLAGLRRAHARRTRLAGLCRGVFVLAQAGLLDDRGATTMHEYTSDFLRQFPRAHLNPDVLYVTDDNITTSAGRAAGMDCCLALVEEFLGIEVAERIADHIVSGPLRYGEHAQVEPRRAPTPEAHRRILQAMDWAKSRLREANHLDELAMRAGMTTRTFIRHFRKLTGTTPKQWLLSQRTAYAQALLDNSQLTVDAIAAATGFEGPSALRKQFKAAMGMSPAGYRQARRSEESNKAA